VPEPVADSPDRVVDAPNGAANGAGGGRFRLIGQVDPADDALWRGQAESGDEVTVLLAPS
jgi:hypothetical protein